MIAFICVLICIALVTTGFLVYDVYYRVTRNMYPFCRKGDKHEK